MTISIEGTIGQKKHLSHHHHHHLHLNRTNHIYFIYLIFLLLLKYNISFSNSLKGFNGKVLKY